MIISLHGEPLSSKKHVTCARVKTWFFWFLVIHPILGVLIMDTISIYHLVMTNIAMENHHAINR